MERVSPASSGHATQLFPANDPNDQLAPAAPRSHPAARPRSASLAYTGERGRNRPGARLNTCTNKLSQQNVTRNALAFSRYQGERLGVAHRVSVPYPPSSLTTSGTLSSSSRQALVMPLAMMAQLTMPPKMFTRTASTWRG